MPALLLKSETRIAYGRLFSLQERISQTITCLSGAIWITQTAEPRDIVLKAGERADLVPHDAIVGSLTGEATVVARGSPALADAA